MDEGALSDAVSKLRERLGPFPAAYDLRYGGEQYLYPPALPDDIEWAEEALGFRLPPLLREVYTKVGNGGERLRLMGIGGGGQHGFEIFEGQDIVLAYTESVEVARTDYYDWPDRLVPIYDGFGCGVTSFLDCRADPWQVFQWDSAGQPVLGAACLSVEAASLAEYLRCT